jgi:hypothetical protein
VNPADVRESGRFAFLLVLQKMAAQSTGSCGGVSKKREDTCYSPPDYDWLLRIGFFCGGSKTFHLDGVLSVASARCQMRS